jgi:ABC-type transport system substrate-binding protein
LPEFKRSNRISYVKNPKFREKLYPSEASPGLEDFLVDAGKPLPLMDKVVVNIIEEEQPRWLNFLQGGLDYINIPKDNFTTAVKNNELSDELKGKNIGLVISPSLDLTYIAFNHDFEIFRNKKVRQAIRLAYDTNEVNKLFYNSTGTLAQSAIPSGLDGYNPNFKSKWATADVELAKELLAEAGFPNGEKFPMIVFGSTNESTSSRQMSEYFQKRMRLIGINVDVISVPFRDLIKDIDGKRSFSMWGVAWSADYPDAETFLQLFYGPNKYPGSNGSGYLNPDYDKTFEKATSMFPSPERTRLYEELNELLAEEVPVIFGVHRKIYTLVSSRIRNFRYSDIDLTTDLYLVINQ